MSENQMQFRQITNLFYNGWYEEGKTQITKLIQEYPLNSALHINRALFYSELGEEISAIEDLEKAIGIHPFNYIAYFNLFSMQTKIYNDRQAFSNLCCSLSCMYLLKAKICKSLQLVEKSIQYASNNTAAHLLKAFILQESNNIEKASAQLKIISLNTSIESVDQKTIDCSQILQGLKKEETTRKFRLNSSLWLSQDADIIQQIKKKVNEFNLLYQDLNQNFGAVTQKVPKQSQVSINIQTFMREKSKITSSNRESVIALLEDEDFFNGSCKKSREKARNFDTNPESMQDIIPFPQEEEKSEPSQTYKEEQEFLDALKTNRISSVTEEKSEYEEQRSENIKEKHSNHQSTNHFIYPRSGKKKLKINLLYFKFLQEPQPNPKNVYCVLNYNNSRVPFSSVPVDCQDDLCTWNERFDSADVSPQPSLLKLKLYSRLPNNDKGMPIGEIQVMVDIADLLKLPIYDRNTQLIGHILIHLQLVSQEGATQ